MADQIPDEEVLRQSLKDPSRFGVLVERYREPFLRKARSVLRESEDAEDAVQETFVRIYKYGSRFKKEAGVEFKSWAYKILMHTSFTRYQRKRRDATHTTPYEALQHDTLQGDDGRTREGIEDAKRVVAEVMTQMPAHLREALELYYLREQSYDEICKALKITSTTLKMRLFRARQLFKRLTPQR